VHHEFDTLLSVITGAGLVVDRVDTHHSPGLGHGQRARLSVYSYLAGSPSSCGMPRCSASGRRLTRGDSRGRDGLSRGRHTELIAIGICYHHPADPVLANVDSTRTEAHETVDLCLLISVDRWREVEMQPVLPDLRSQWRTAPRDLRTAARRADRRLLVSVPDQLPAQRFAPEVPDLLRTVARNRSDESAISKEVVAQNSLPSGSASTT